jgi:hypothetical protein
MKPSAQPAPPGPAVVTLAEVADHPPEPTAPAEPAPVGVLSVLNVFVPSVATTTYSATMGRDTATMITHARDRVIEAVHMFEQIKFDAVSANDLDGVAVVNGLIARLA